MQTKTIITTLKNQLSLNTTELAQELSTSKQTIYRILNDQSVSERTLRKIVKTFIRSQNNIS